MIYIVIATLLVSIASAQPRMNVDSLQAVWEDKSLPDNDRFNAYQALILQNVLYSRPDSAFQLAANLYNLASDAENTKYQGEALNIQGTAKALMGDFPGAETYFQKALDVFEKGDHKKGIAGACGNLAIISADRGDYDLAMDYIRRGMAIEKEMGNRLALSKSLNNLGIIAERKGDIASSIKYHVESMKIKEELGDIRGYASSLTNVGHLWEMIDNSQKAREYYFKALRTQKEINDLQGLGNTYTNLGSMYMEESPDSAIHYFDLAVNVYEDLKDRQGYSSVLGYLGTIYRMDGQFERSTKIFTEALEISRDIGFSRGITRNLNDLARNYFDAGEIDRTIKLASEALDLGQKSGEPEAVKNAAYALFQAYEKKGRTGVALNMHKLYFKMRDSIKSANAEKEITRQEFRIEYEKQAAEDSISALEAQKIADAEIKAERARSAQKEQQAYFLIGFLVVTLGFGVFSFNRFRVTRQQKKIIEEQKHTVDEAFHRLEAKNQEVLDSINYAKRIQKAILPPMNLVKENLPESFVLYKPKDIVAGDFYWMEISNDDVFFAAADCTGHGVPGAMVSVICNNGLNRSVREYAKQKPGEILDSTRKIVIEEFSKSEDEVKDGMDIALMRFKKNSGQIEFAGANNPLWIVRSGEVLVTPPNKQPIGKFDLGKPFDTQIVETQPGDSLYMFTDGYIDQFGGPKGKKFKSNRLKELLLSINGLPMKDQQEKLDKTIEEWRGDLEQIDDICVIGIKV